MNLTTLSEYILIFVGLFLASDDMLFHNLNYTYPTFLEWSNPYVEHSWLGILFVVVGILGLVMSRRKRN